MKMQNAEMEFVAFDAQDVIATSGPSGLDNISKVKFQGMTGKEYNNTYGGFDFGPTNDIYDDLNETFGYSIENKPTTDSGEWNADYSSTTNPSALAQYKQLDDVDGIVSWLEAHGYIPHSGQ